MPIAALPSSDPGPLPAAVRDRWILWPVAFAIAVAAGLALLWQWPGAPGSIAILLSLVAGPVVAIAVLVTAVVFAVRKRPRKAMSALLVLVIPAALWSPLSLAADYVHLGMTAGFGVGQLGTARQFRPGGPTVYDWTVEMDGGPRTYLVFDETDEIAAPPGPDKAPSVSEPGIEPACAAKARRLMAHYSVCSF